MGYAAISEWFALNLIIAVSLTNKYLLRSNASLNKVLCFV